MRPEFWIPPRQHTSRAFMRPVAQPIPPHIEQNFGQQISPVSLVMPTLHRLAWALLGRRRRRTRMTRRRRNLITVSLN
jgi:hypothetical protein